MEGFKLKTKETRFKQIYLALHIPQIWNGKTIFYVHGGPGSHSYDFEVGIQKFDALNQSGYAFITYDQRGSGRSETNEENSKNLSHKNNIEDLNELIAAAAKIFNLERIDLIYGHSYGARLVYDFLWAHPEINIKYILASINLYPIDAFNTSLFLDLFLLKKNQPKEFKEALKIISDNEKEPYLSSPLVRKLFQSLEQRQKDRQQFYWANNAALSWWNEINTRSNVRDNDHAYFRIVETFYDEDFNPGSYDPKDLNQHGKYIVGFHDILMGGSNTFSSSESNIVKFYSSSHYPHFEEPEYFIQIIRSIFANENNFNNNYNFYNNKLQYNY